MIRPIDIRLNAAHPELPLVEAFTFTGSPSTVLVRNVPPNCGRWAITAVNVAATFPDNSTTTRAAVQSANGVWVATLPATATSGRTASGLRIMADGIDENGEIVTGYILGVADFAVASLGISPEPGETSYQMLYFDTIPSVLHKGDVTKIDGVLKFYDGTAWQPFANIDPSNYVPTSRTINGKPLTDNVSLSGSDIPTSAAPNSPTLANSISTLTNTTQTLSDSISTLNNTKASKSDATLTPIYRFSGWTANVLRAENIAVTGLPLYQPQDSEHEESYGWYLPTSQGPIYLGVYDKDAVSLSFNAAVDDWYLIYTATRTRTDVIGYRLGPDADTNPNRDKPLQPKGDYPTKAQMDEGWWSETGVCTPSVYNGRPVFAATALTDSGYNPDDPDSSNLTGYWCVFYADSTTRDARASLAAPKNPADVTGETIVWDAIDSWGSGVTATRHRVAAPVPTKPEDIGAATRAPNPTAGNLAALDAQGNPTDSLIPAANVALKGNIPYDLVTKTIANGEVTLADRAANAVTISATLSPNTLTVNFPTATTTGKVRDFALRLNIAAGVTAPEITWPQGVTLENDGGEVPEIADGGTGGSSTILYFSETATNKFLVKGETLTAIAQA